MIIKYQRTSTSKQHGNRFSTDKNTYDLVLFDKGISGTKKFMDRTNGKKVVELVESGKVSEFIVEEIRDIGRNTIDCMNILDWLEKNEVKISIRSLGNLSSRVNGKKNEIWGLITSIMSSLYQMELDNLRQRTQMGRDAYLMNGGVLGRKKGTNESIKQFLDKPKTKEIISLIDKGKSVRDIAGRLSVSHNLIIKTRKHYLPKTA